MSLSTIADISERLFFGNNYTVKKIKRTGAYTTIYLNNDIQYLVINHFASITAHELDIAASSKGVIFVINNQYILCTYKQLLEEMNYLRRIDYLCCCIQFNFVFYPARLIKQGVVI